MPMEINRSEGDVVVRLHGPLTAENSDSLVARVRSCQQQQPSRRYILDASAMTMIDSSGIGSLVTCRQHLRQTQSDLCLAGLQGRALWALKIARADQILSLHADVAEARAAPARE